LSLPIKPDTTYQARIQAWYVHGVMTLRIVLTQELTFEQIKSRRHQVALGRGFALR